MPGKQAATCSRICVARLMNAASGLMSLGGAVLPRGGLVVFRGERFGGLLAQCLLDETAGIFAGRAGVAGRLHGDFAGVRYNDDDFLVHRGRLRQRAVMVSLMLPSACGCSLT